MILTKHIRNFPISRIDNQTEQWLLVAVEKAHFGKPWAIKKSLQALFLFNAFLDVTHSKFTIVSMNNTKSPIRLLLNFIGFLYSHTDASQETAEQILRAIIPVFNMAAQSSGINFSFQTAAISSKTSGNGQHAINSFRSMKIDKVRYRFYEGWLTQSKNGSDFFVDLVKVHNQYGIEICENYFKIISRYLSKYPTTTASQKLSNIKTILKVLCDTFPDEKSLATLNEPSEVNRFTEYMFNLHILKATTEKLNMRSNYTVWRQIIVVIEDVFVKQKLFVEPEYELFCPIFKTSERMPKTNIKHDEDGSAFNTKLITHIPLAITDDDAIEVLIKHIHQDIEFVVDVCQTETRRTMSNLEKRTKAAHIGIPVPVDLGLGVNHRIETSDYCNRCATWEKYQFEQSNLRRKSCLYGQNFALSADEMALLTPYILLPFLYLIVHQHPEITQAWLINLELFDSNSKPSGYSKSGKSFVAISYKGRRGAKSAQQTVILNPISKALFDDVISITQQARQYLKKTGDEQWRYFLLASNSGFSLPHRLKFLPQLDSTTYNDIPLASAILAASTQLAQSRVRSVFNNLSLTSMRASCGVQVYLETKSVHEMAKALGHKEYSARLICRYLPEPIQRFFVERWIRIYQNAIVYEAMQESPHVLESLDLNSEAELREFLENHRLKPLPDHLVHGGTLSLNQHDHRRNNAEFDDVYLPVSPAILSVYLSLVKLVEAAPSIPKKVNETATLWYDTAKFILTAISGHDSGTLHIKCSDDVVSAYKRAITHGPIDKNLKRAVYAS